jgi:four helix bundle protein
MANEQCQTGQAWRASARDLPMKGDDITERLIGFAVLVIKVVNSLPDTLIGRHLAGQLLRAGTSPGANYEEARGAESRRDFLHKLGITLKELQESRYWLKVIHRSELTPTHLVEPAVQEADELVRIIGTSQRTARTSPQQRG